MAKPPMDANANIPPEQIEELAPGDLVDLTSDAQAIVAHIRALEVSFLAAIESLPQTHALTQARTCMAAAREWVVTHFSHHPHIP